MTVPGMVVVRDHHKDKRKVSFTYHYTPAERGQIMAFVWWVYVNRGAWDRETLRSAVTILSPLMLFSSSFLADMADIPSSTVTKYMTKAPDMTVSRVTGRCDIWTVYRLLSASAAGLDTYRDTVREISLTRGVPDAMMERLSGVPADIIRRPERGIQFFPERPDLETGNVRSPEQMKLYWKYHTLERKNYDPDPGDQFSARHALAGKDLGTFRTTAAPVPDGTALPHHFSIPGLPSLRECAEDPQRFFKLVRDWESTYHFSASAYVGSGAARESA